MILVNEKPVYLHGIHMPSQGSGVAGRAIDMLLLLRDMEVRQRVGRREYDEYFAV